MDATEIDIFRGASRLVRLCGDVGPDEHVLVISDARSVKYGQAVTAAASEVTPHVTMVTLRTFGRIPGQDPTRPVAAAMKAADVVFAITEVSLVHSPARRAASEAGVRFLSTTQPDDQMFGYTIAESPFEEMMGPVDAVNALLSAANEAHITTWAGTDLWLDLRGRVNVEKEYGYTRRGADSTVRFAAPPVIESNISPVEYTARGRLVVDAHQAALGMLRESITFTIEQGRITAIEGGSEARQLETFLKKIEDPGMYLVAELGIGMNPIAKVRGRFPEDESAYGTAHIGIGSALFAGGTLEAKGHLDNVFWHPTIELDGKTVMAAGRLVYPGAPNIVGHYAG